MSNTNFKLRGVVKNIGDLIHMEKKNGPDLYKKVLTIETSDEQKLYIDVINIRLKSLEDQNIQVDSIVEIEYSFKGSERDGKKYNNIFCNSVKKV